MVSAPLESALSAVMDGHATAEDWARVEAAWARDPALRERWALWQAAGDGLRSTDLLAAHRHPADLLRALHAATPQPAARAARGREWLAPFAVAAGFVALAVGIVQWQPAVVSDASLARAGQVPTLSQGLVGASFAQTATGRLPPVGAATRDVAWPADPSGASLGWDVSAPDAAASQARP